MSDVHVHKIQATWKKRALIDSATYQKWYEQSVKNPDAFWGEHGKRLDWFKPYTKVKNTSFTGKVAIKWFEDGQLNVSYNCIDRHLKKRGDQVAIIWEGDNPYDDKKITYKELYGHVCRLANVLKKHGVKKGDRVTIYMPMIPEAAYAMLACTRIGAIHSIVFGGFSPDSLAGRIVDAESTFVITADEGLRGGKTIPLKENTDKAIDIAARNYVTVKTVLVVRRTGGKVGWANGRDHLVSRRGRLGAGRVQAGEDEGRAPALHPLHLRLDRQAEGRAAHDRRLSRLCLDDPPICVRLP